MQASTEKVNRSVTATRQPSRNNLFSRSEDRGSFFRPAKPFVQARLEVSKPDDPHEREAERTAESVMRMPTAAMASETAASPPAASSEPEKLQRLEEHEEQEQEIQLQREPGASWLQCGAEPEQRHTDAKPSSAPPVSDQREEARPTSGVSVGRCIQRRSTPFFHSDVVQRAGRGPPAQTETFETQLQQSKGAGQTMPAGTRRFMESRFQSDFAGVRIHTGVTAQSLSKSIHAQAFTHGGDIYFNSGKYDPDSHAGRTLLAHELTHTIQQGASPPAATTNALSTAPISSASSSHQTSRQVIQRQATVPQLTAAVTKAKGEEGKVNANKPGPDGNRTGWERLLEYFKTAMGPDKIVSGGGSAGYVPGTVSEDVIKKKSQAMGQVANQPPDVQAMRDAMPSWCGIFVFWALNKGGVPMPKWVLGGPAIKREAAYPPDHTPTTGDIAYRNEKSHYAIVEKTDGAGGEANVTTVNGNTAGEDNLGAQIQTRSHKRSSWTGFFNPLVLMQGSLRGVEDSDAKPKSLRDLRRELFHVDRARETEESVATGLDIAANPMARGIMPNASASAKSANEAPLKLDRLDEHEHEEKEIEEDQWIPEVHYAVLRRVSDGTGPLHAIDRARPAFPDGSVAPSLDISRNHSGAHGSENRGQPQPSSVWQSERGPPVRQQGVSATVQRSWLGNAWNAVTGFASEAAHWVEEGLEAAKRWLLGRVRDFVRGIPGYRMLSFILAEDPITGERVERNGRNLLYAGLDLLPAGGLFQAVIERIGAVDDLSGYLDRRIDDLTSLAAGISDRFSRFWDGISLTDVRDPEGVFNRVAELFHSTIGGITNFVTNAAVDFLDMIKRIMLREIVGFVRDQIPRLYPLLCVALGHDPVTNVEVPRNGTNILNAVLEVSEQGREQRRQMQETGTFQRIAGFIDRGIVVFTTAYQQLRAAFSGIWDIVTIDALVHPVDTFNRIYDQFAAPVRLVTDYIVDVATEILRVIKDVLMRRLSAYARTVRGYPLVTVILGSDPFTGEAVPRNVENIIHGFMSLMEGGEQQFQQMKESGAIDQTAARIHAAVERLNMTPGSILQLFIDLWHSFSLSDLAHPIAAFQRIMARFGEPIARLIAFVVEIVRIVVEVILRIMNFPLDLIGNIISRTVQAFHLIKADPIGFLKNLLRAIKQGFIQFFDNILTHLLNGVTGWLMSELQDAGVPTLSDFSLRGVIGWVLQVLGISMEKIWEKLAAHPRIGPARVAQIRSMINRLEGIWTFIKDVQERGMAAIWDKIQEQLSNLWNTVLDAVKNWIMDKIVNAVVTKLLSMLDPTGIMAVVNSAIAIYRAVQSFIRYLTQMLQVVNSFVEGVVEIASGSIGRAANALENAMDRAMPVVIGFLANQVGLGGIGSRIGEMIVRVRELVDQALTWLVNKAVDTGFALFDRLVSAGRSAVATVRGWMQGLVGLQQPFTAPDNSSHRLYYEQQGDNLKLMINPGPAGEFTAKISEIQPPAAPNDRVNFPAAVSIPLMRNNAVASTVVAQPDSDQKISMATLKLHAITVAQHIDSLIASRRRTSSDQTQQAATPGAATGTTDQTADFTASLQGLSQITGFLVSATAAGPLPVSPVPTYGGLNNGFATRMEVKPLTKLGVPGSGVTVDSPDYSALLLRRETPGGRSFYIAGHLLNNNVHGDGSTWQNLTPIAQRTNQQHESRVESKVKNAVEHDRILQYVVEVDYAVGLKTLLLQAIEQDPNWRTNSVLSQKHQIIEAEAKLPTQLRCTVKQIKADGTDADPSEPGFDPAYNVSGAGGIISNEDNVPQNSLDDYYLSSAASVTYLDLSTLQQQAGAALQADPDATWEPFYNNAANPGRKLSIDHLSDDDRQRLRDIFRRRAMFNEEMARINGLSVRQSQALFEAGRVPYTGTILTDSDKTRLRGSFSAKMSEIEDAALQQITIDIQTTLTDPNTRWGDFRNNNNLGARLSADKINQVRGLFDQRISSLRSSSPATSAPPLG